MAGVKGRSGGARAGTGGARPGSGRPKKPIPVLPPARLDEKSDPKAFLLRVMSDGEADARMRIDAAKALLPYLYPKQGEGGKKVAQNDAARNVAGRFASAVPPKLAAVGGKKI